MIRRPSARRQSITLLLRQNDRHRLNPIGISVGSSKVAERGRCHGMATDDAGLLLGCRRCSVHSLDSQERWSGQHYRPGISADLMGVVNDAGMTGGTSRMYGQPIRDTGAVPQFLYALPPFNPRATSGGKP